MNFTNQHQTIITYLIINYFNKINLNFINVINCWSDYDNYNLIKVLSANYISSSVVTLNEDKNVTIFVENLIKNRDHSSIGIFIDYDCPKSNTIIQQCSTFKCFSMNFKWLMIQKTENDDLISELKKTNLHIDCEITYVDLHNPINTTDNNILYPMYDIYNNGYNIGGKFNMTFDSYFFVNFITKKFYITNSVIKAKTKYYNRCNMSDVTMRLIVVTSKTRLDLPTELLVKHLESSNNSYIDTLPRFGYKLINHLQEMLLYNVTYSTIDSWSFNDSAGGAFGELLNENADQSVSPFFISIGRIPYVRVIAIIGNFKSMFIFRTPHSDEMIGNVFFKPFSPSVWLCLLVMIILTSICLKCSFAVESKNKLFNRLLFVPSWILTMISTIGAVCQQSSSVVPVQYSGRIIFIVFFLSTVLLYNFYTSEIVSTLIGSPVKSKIKTLKQLTDSRLGIGIDNAAYTLTYLNISKEPDVEYFIRKRITQNANSQLLWINPEQGIQLVRRGGFAYHCEASIAYALIRNLFEPLEICELNEIYLQPKKSLGVYVKKNSPYFEIMRIRYLRMIETGIVSKYRQHWIKQKPICMSGSSIPSVGWEYTGTLFLFLITAMIIALIILLCEIIHKKCLLNKKTQQMFLN